MMQDGASGLLRDGRAVDTLCFAEKILAQPQVAWTVCHQKYQLWRREEKERYKGNNKSAIGLYIN